MSDDKHIAAKEMLLEDACDAQRGNGKLPSVADNERFLQGVLNNLDRRRSEAKPVVQRPGTSKKEGAFEQEVRTRAARAGFTIAGDYKIERGGKQPLALGGSALEVRKQSVPEQRMRARLRLLRSKPDWYAKLKRVNPLALQGQFGPEKQKVAADEIRKIIDESNWKFGHWMKPPPARKLVFGPSGNPVSSDG